MKCCVALAVSFLSGLSSFAGVWDDGNTWFVATNGADIAASSGGGTEAAPFRTLQFAHDQASAGDTIKLAPGVYAEGEVGDGKHTNRLVVAKKLRFRSTDGKAKTVIEGRLENGSYGLTAVRCVSVKATGYDCEFHDLTFRNGGGGTNSADSVGASCGLGGCVYVAGSRDAAAGADHHRAYFVDCDIVGGVTPNYGGGMYGGTAIRCLIRDCKGNSWGSSACAAMLWNCVVFNDLNTSGTGSSSRPAIGFSAVAVNCTVYGARRSGCDRNARLYNTFIVNSGTYDFHSYKDSWAIQRYNCVGGSETNDFYQLMSPATGDFRPIAGKPIVGGGLTSYLTNSAVIRLPEDTEMTDFNGNPLDLESETCNVGAVQGAGVTPATGRITVNSGMTAEGWPVGVQGAYSYAESFPATLVLRLASATCMRLQTSKGYSKLGFIYPQYDGTAHVGYPHDVTQYRSFSEVEPKATFWTDPKADAETADGTEEHPFRTLQAAVDHIVASNLSSVVVNAKPGVYAEGGAVGQGLMSRVVLPADNAILIRSTGGAAVTTIRGASDPNSTSDLFPGCGSAAIRCVAVENLTVNSALQGFTFADGRTDCVNAGTKMVASDAGAGVCFYGAGKASLLLQVLDCTFMNCVAPYRAAAMGGLYTRCRFTHCTAWGGLISNCHLSGCLTDETCTLTEKPAGGVTDDGRMFAADSRTLHCTILNGTVFCGTDLQRYSFSSLLYKSAGRGGGYYYYGSVFDAKQGSGSGSAGFLQKNIVFADPEHGDYRLLAGTDAVFAGILPSAGASYYSVWETAYSELVSSDIDGRRILYKGGIPLAGCYQTTAPRYSITTTYGGVKVTGVPDGSGLLPADAVVTVTPDAASATRPCFRFVLNGETNDLATATERTFTFDDLAATGGIEVKAIYEPHWYVNPDPSVGDDANDGFTPETPKKTLAGAMAANIKSGDTVHAAPGRYAEGESRKAGATHPPERVYIPGGVTLVGDEGAAKTFIVGRLGTDEYTDTLGCGSNSMRCVNMAANAVLRGFTLTDGSAYPAPTAGSLGIYGEPYNHGAVWAGSRHTTFVCDCVVSNCAAYNCAAGREVSFVNTLLTGNRARIGITSEANLFGCVVDGNYADSGSVYKFTYAYDSTFGPHAYKLNGKAGTALASYSTVNNGRLVNCLVLGPCSTSKLDNPAQNCVFAEGKVTGTILNNASNCLVVAADRLQVDDDLRPIAGKNDACDFADETLVTPNANDNAHLVPLRARANNGGLDAGALEADCRGLYAQILAGKRGFTVTEATGGVRGVGGRTVVIGPGESLAAEWAANGRARSYDLWFWVTGSGSLTLTFNGESTVYEASEQGYRVHLDGAGGSADRFSFTFAGEDGFAELVSVKSPQGLLILIDGGASSGPVTPAFTTVRVSDFGYDAEDSTRFIQRALDSGADKVILDNVEGGVWNTLPLKMRSDTELEVEPGVVLQAKRGAFQGLRDYLFEVPDGVCNVAIRGGEGSTFRMWKEDYQDEERYEQGEWRYALRLHNCTNALVEGLRICEAGGDGIGVSGRDITIRNCVCDNNHRQGISVFNVENLLIEGCVLSNTKGTPPQAGIDFEPDRNKWLMSNVTMRDCLFENNTGTGIDIYLDKLRADATPVSMRFENCRTVGNSSSVSVNPGARAGDHVRGKVEFVGCSFESARGNGVVLKNKAADAFDVSFSDCVVSNATDTSVVCSIAGDDLPGQPDGIDFGDLTVFLNADKPWFKLTTQGFGPAPTRLSGAVTVVSPDGARRVETIDADWIAANIRLINSGEPSLPRVTYPSAESVTAVDTCPGELVDLTPFQDVSSDRQYVFLLGEGGGEAKFVARQVVVAAGRELSTNQLTVAPLVGGKKADTVRLDIPGTNATELAFSATKGGFYVLKVPETGTRFVIDRASVPVAVDNTKAKVSLAGGTKDGKRQPFDLWFHTPADAAFQVVVHGSDYYRFKASVADPQGTVRFSRDLVEDAQMYVSEGTIPEGLWRIGFEKAAKSHYDWIGVDLLGVPGLLFLTPDKYWR